MIDAVLHWLGYGLCHQLPERSFVAGGHQLPVCARDTGIYLGFVIALAVIAWLDRGRRRTEMPPAWLLGVGALFVVAMGVDGVTSYAGLRTTTNELRLLTGLLTGYAIALIVVPLVASQLWDPSTVTRERVLGAPLEAAVWVATIPAAYALVWWGGPAMGTVYALLSAAAIILTFTAVNLIVVLLAPRFECRSRRLRDAWMPLLFALVLTGVEIAASGLLRATLLSWAAAV